MIAALQVLVIGALTFVPQDLPDLPNDFASAYRLADLDGNGEQDLVLSHVVYFQSGGTFSALKKTAPPAAGTAAACDIWHDVLYLRVPEGLQTARWEGSGWRVLSEQPVAWPNPGNQMTLPVYAAAAGLRFERFLHDFDGDGWPELFVPDELGLRVFRRTEGDLYTEAASLEVFPPLQLAPVEGQPLWPASERGVMFPARAMNCSYNISGNAITIVARENRPTMTRGTLARYRVKTFTIDAGLEIVPEETREVVTEPFPPHLQLMRLNDDGRLDIAGGEAQSSARPPVRVPVYETRGSTDGGQSFTTRRVSGFTPNQSFIDVNDDGRADLVTESTGLFKGGLREAMSRLLTSREITHDVRAYFQQADGTFSNEADVRGAFTIVLDAAPMVNSRMFGRYRAGELVNLTGDFDGDRIKDAVVQDRPDRLAVYRGVAGGFEERPAASIAAIGIERFSVGDYNGDGRADVAVHGHDDENNVSALNTTIYLAGEGAE